MKKNLILSFFVMILLFHLTGTLSAQKTSKVIIFPILNQTDHAYVDALTDSVNENVFFMISQMEQYKATDESEKKIKTSSYSETDMQNLAKSKRCDYIVCGTISGQNPLKLTLSVYDRKNKKIVVSKEAPLNKMTEVFDVSDRLMLVLLEDMTGEEIVRGELVFVNKGAPGSFGISINGRKFESGITSIQMMKGHYFVIVESIVNGKKIKIFSEMVKISEGEKTEISFILPSSTPSKTFGRHIDQWEGYDDSAHKGTSSINVQFSETTVSVTGSVTTDYQFGYIGLMYHPDPKELSALKISKGIRFKVKGDGKSYEFYLQATNVKDYCFHRKAFKTSEEWKTVEIFFNRLSQPDWGQRIPLKQNLAYCIAFQPLNERPLDSVRFSIKDIELF